MLARFLALAMVMTMLFSVAIPTYAQEDETFEWDGDTSDDWFVTTNWSVFGDDPNPGLGDPLVPDEGSRVEIFHDGSGSIPAPIITSGAALANQVRIGRSGGAGKLTINGGSLSTGAESGTIKFRVGNGNPGTLLVNGGTINVINGTMTTGDGGNFKGQITMTSGAINITGANRDLNMDEMPSGNSAGSNLNVSGGTISIADVLLVDNMASIDLSGGTITTAVEQPGALRVRRDGEIRITGGLLETKDDLEMGNNSIPGGSIRLDGGILRGFRLGNIGSGAEIAVNGTGLVQFNNSQFDIPTAEGFITSGLFTTVAPGGLGVSLVDIAGTTFTQIAVLSGLTGDFDLDGDVDGRDFLIWQRGNSPSGPLSPADLSDWQSNYGGPLLAVSAVPEPATVGLAMLFILFGLSRRSCQPVFLGRDRFSS